LFSGSAVVFSGLLFRIGFLVLYEVVAARYFGPAGYGLFTLAFTVVLAVSALPCFGLQTSLGRFIAYHRETREPKKVRGLIAFGLLWPLGVGLLIATLLYWFSGIIAIRVFEKPELAHLLRILAFIVPLWSTRRLSISIFSGYQKPFYKLALEDFSDPLLRVVSVALVAVAGLGLVALGNAILIAYVLIACVAWFLVWSGARRIVEGTHGLAVPWGSLIAFGTPLIFSELAEVVLAWIDVLMLGMLSVEYQVGLFRSSSQPPMLASAVLTSFSFIYLPMATQMFARRDREGWKEANSSVARWTLSLAFPIATVCVLFPEVIIRILFGPSYSEGAAVMRILGIAYLLHAGVGFTGLNLIVAGHTALQMFGKLISITTHVGLNLLWIPKYGAAGAAAAMLASIVLSNGYNLFMIRWRLGLLQFTGRYFALLGIHLISAGGMWAATRFLGLSPVAAMLVVGGLELPVAVILALILRVDTEADRKIIVGLRNRLCGWNDNLH
jgi:O-antigen/teichoic acid export membrane protein